MAKTLCFLLYLLAIGYLHPLGQEEILSKSSLSPKPSLHKHIQFIQTENEQKLNYPESFFSHDSEDKHALSLQDILAPGVRIVTPTGAGSANLILTVSGEMIRVGTEKQPLYYGPLQDFMSKIHTGAFMIEKPATPQFPSLTLVETNL